jgi:hypothetical protein
MHSGAENMSRSLLRLSSVAALVLALSISGQHCRAMDRWAALSQLESGDDDSVRGAAGEVSRYQVRPEIWEQYAEAKMNWRAPADALLVAQRIMKHRCAEFERAFRRQPNDFEFYILWNAPARIGDPAKAVRERAARFSNLVSKPGYIRTLPPERSTWSPGIPEQKRTGTLGTAAGHGRPATPARCTQQTET